MRAILILAALTCLFPNVPAEAGVRVKSPTQVCTQAFRAQALCFRNLAQSLKAGGGECGNSGCGIHVWACWSAGESVVRQEAEHLLDAARGGTISETCHQALEELSKGALYDFDQQTMNVLNKVPSDVQGDALILHRLLAYELMQLTYSQKECRAK